MATFVWKVEGPGEVHPAIDLRQVVRIAVLAAVDHAGMAGDSLLEGRQPRLRRHAPQVDLHGVWQCLGDAAEHGEALRAAPSADPAEHPPRSEERRVGQEWQYV